ncbi:MAG: OB-fold domain-containing protein [Microbacterium sp.]|uniref:Zn-ribbon domain-containing OB-fold protein n=1 Tax=Microbacterium sp. TaxID=51671 RepID=UPI0039E5B710
MRPSFPPPSPVIPDLDTTMLSLETVSATGRLRGTRCTDCGARAFPARAVCHRCGGTSLASHDLGTTGRLYSWTTVRVSSTREIPYSIGYVDIDDEVRVLGRLVGESFEIDEIVEVSIDDHGWAFVRATRGQAR